MSKYEALGPNRFANQYWQAPRDFHFLSHQPVLPIGVHEAPMIGLHVPLAFIQQQNGYDLVALAGLQEGQNLLVDPLSGRWQLDYIPDIAKVHPFRLAPHAANSDELVVVVDTESGLITRDSNDFHFFKDNGQPSEALDAVTQVLERLHRGRMACIALCKSLQNAELFEPWPLRVQDGEITHEMKGLFRINENALRELGNVPFLALRKNNALGLAYAQMMSTGNTHTLGRLAYQRQQQGIDTTTTQDFGSDTISFN